MIEASKIKEHAEGIGADCVHVAMVDGVEGVEGVEDDRIKLTKKDSCEGQHKGHHHQISLSLVAEVEGETVRLSGNGDVAVTFEGGK
jgi:hypothetical protein